MQLVKSELKKVESTGVEGAGAPTKGLHVPGMTGDTSGKVGAVGTPRWIGGADESGDDDV